MIPDFRPATPQDLPMVFRLERAYIQVFEPESSLGWHGVIDRHIEQWVANLSRMFVAEIAGQAVGYYFWEVSDKDAVLSSINVLPDYRRQGIGAVLIKHFENQALEHNMQRLTLGVIKHNPAKHLYEATGYVYVRQEGDYCYYEKSPAGGEGA